MTATEAEPYRQKLLALQRELTSDAARIEPEIREPDELATQDYGDRSTSTYSKESLLQRLSYETETLEQIEAALRRIHDGTYGVCGACGQRISPKRLEAVPWTDVCLECQGSRDEQQRAAQGGGASSRVVV